MKKLLYIAPHLSTGGQPQFLTKKIQLLYKDYDLYIIEYADHTGGVLVVQKERIQKIIPPEKFYVLGEDKMEVIKIIKDIKHIFDGISARDEKIIKENFIIKQQSWNDLGSGVKNIIKIVTPITFSIYQNELIKALKSDGVLKDGETNA